jgi:hypothetical protein
MHKSNTSRNDTLEGIQQLQGELMGNFIEIWKFNQQHKLNHGSNDAQKREMWELLDLNLWKYLPITKSSSNATPSKGYMIDM